MPLIKLHKKGGKKNMAKDILLDSLTEEQTKKIIKKNNAIEKVENDTLKSGDNSKILTHNFRLYKLTKVDMKDVEAIERRIAEYITICTEDDARPTVEGLALALGINRRTLWKYAYSNDFKVSDVIRDTLKKAYDFLNVYMVDLMYSNKINSINGIFLMKNNFDYKDKSEVVLTPNTQNNKDATELKDEYLLENDIINENE